MILITGATGLVGRALVTEFMAQDVPLRLQVTNRNKLFELFPHLKQAGNVEIIELDFTKANAENMNSLCQSCKTVIHAAALVHQPDAAAELYNMLNLRPTTMLASAAALNHVTQFVFLSTIAVYGSVPLNATSEDRSLAPDTPYGLSKAKCEEYLLQNEIAASLFILRPSLLFGEGDRGNMLSLIRQVLRKRYFHIGGGSALKSLMYARDLAGAIRAILQKNVSGRHIFNMANPEPVSMRTLAEAIASVGDVTAGIPSLPELPVRLAAGTASLILGARSPLNIDRVEKLTRSTFVSTKAFEAFCDFRPQHSLVQSLQAEIIWARAAGLI